MNILIILLSARRDKEFCHECRFCCTLSVCTNQHGTYFRESSDKNMTGAKNKAEWSTVRLGCALIYSYHGSATPAHGTQTPKPPVSGVH